MTDHDDDPTPVRRLTSQHDAIDGGSGIRMRLHTPAHGYPTLEQGTPVAVVIEPSRRTRSRSDSDEPPHNPLDERIDERINAHFARQFRKLWRWLGISAGTAVVALAAAGRSWIGGDAHAVDAQAIERAAAERARAEAERLLHLEIDSLRAAIYRGRRDEQPDLPTTSASKRIP